MLMHEGLINLELVQKILRWRHTGFNVHAKVRTTTKREADFKMSAGGNYGKL